MGRAMTGRVAHGWTGDSHEGCRRRIMAVMEPSDEELALARRAVEARQGPQPAVREAWVERDGPATLVHVVFGAPNDTAAGDRYLTWIVTLRGGEVTDVQCLGSIACSPR